MADAVEHFEAVKPWCMGIEELWSLRLFARCGMLQASQFISRAMSCLVGLGEGGKVGEHWRERELCSTAYGRTCSSGSFAKMRPLSLL